MNLARGDVVVALFPNSDGSPPKPRPALVVQSDLYNVKLRNVILAAITSNLKHAGQPTSILIFTNTREGIDTGLKVDSVVSCINIATVENTLIARKIGQLSHSLLLQVDSCLKLSLDLS